MESECAGGLPPSLLLPFESCDLYISEYLSPTMRVSVLGGCLLPSPWPAPCSPLPPADCVLLPRQSRRSAAGAVTAAPPRGHSQNYLQSPALEHQGGTGAASVHVSSFSTQQLHHFPFQVSFPLSAPDSLVKAEESNLVEVKAKGHTST